MSEFRVCRLMVAEEASNPLAWACLAVYPALEVAEERLRGWFQDDEDPGSMDAAYDPSTHTIEEWDDLGLAASWRLEPDFDMTLTYQRPEE